jgi:hypothetical protein
MQPLKKVGQEGYKTLRATKKISATRPPLGYSA